MLDLGKTLTVVAEIGRFAGSSPIADLDQNQFAEQHNSILPVSGAEELTNFGPLPAPPRKFELIACGIDSASRLVGETFIPGEEEIVHTVNSDSQTNRMRCNLRSTDRGTQPNRWAISSFVSPSTFQRAIDFSCGSPRVSRNAGIPRRVRRPVGRRLAAEKLIDGIRGGHFLGPPTALQIDRLAYGDDC